MPKDTPAPNQYKNIIKYTETSYQFSIPKAFANSETQLAKTAQIPGPGSYNIKRDLNGGLAKSILGGADVQKKDIDNGVPGPGTYDSKEVQYKPPGFRIVPH